MKLLTKKVLIILNEIIKAESNKKPEWNYTV